MTDGACPALPCLPCSPFYKNCHAVILVYDVTDAKSFDHVEEWLADCKNHAPGTRTLIISPVHSFADLDWTVSENVPMLLIGNKADLADERAVTTEEAQVLNRFDLLRFVPLDLIVLLL